MNILITGGNGFIGSHLVKKLLNSKNKLFLTTRSNSNLQRIRTELNSLTLINIDKDNLENFFSKTKIDLIIHLSTSYIKNEKASDISNLINTNVTFPSSLLYLAVKNNVKHFINTGTCFEYLPKKGKISEKSSLRPLNFYTSTKAMFEGFLKTYADQKKIKAVTLKLFFPYGEMDNDKLVKLLVEASIKNKKIEVTKGEQLLSFTYIEDIVDAYLKTIDYIKKMDLNYDIFNIGGRPIVMKEIMKSIELISNKNNIFSKTRPYQKNEIMTMIADSAKAKKKLGWIPRYTIKESLPKIYNFYKTKYD
jgi:nucleoside-diphosphate-sugar epimerase